MVSCFSFVQNEMVNHTGTQTGRPYGLRCPHRTAPHGRNLSSATAAPAPAPCFRRRRRSPAQLFSSLSEATREQTKKEKALRFRRAFIFGALKGTLPRTFRQSAGLSDPAGTQTGRTCCSRPFPWRPGNKQKKKKPYVFVELLSLVR